MVDVYNTTDNRNSLSITDLSSDGEYSVTVAGRDGVGRLGQESEQLILRNPFQHVLFGYNAQQKSVIVQWEVSIVTSFCENNAQSMLACMYF